MLGIFRVLGNLLMEKLLPKMDSEMKKVTSIIDDINKVFIKLKTMKKMTPERKKNLEEIIMKKEGKILEIYYNPFSSSYTQEFKVTIMCNKDNNIWTASVSGIIHHGTWCPQCAGHKPWTLEYAQKVAKDKGGECLSKEYINMTTYMEWKCGNPEHKSWKIPLSNIALGGNWCPECARKFNVNEELVRACLMILFPGYSFDNTRGMNIEFLLNKLTGYYLELDAYCQLLRLAAEYNGIQHYELSKQFHDGPDDLIAQQSRDKMKQDMCIESKINLIIIKYNVNKSDMLKTIYDELKKIAIHDEKIRELLPKELPNISILEIDALASKNKLNQDKEKYNKMLKLVTCKGGTLQTDKYVSCDTTFNVVCGNKNNPHTFVTNYHKLINEGKWCHQCMILERATSVNHILTALKDKVNIINIIKKDKKNSSKEVIIYENGKNIEIKDSKPEGLAIVTFQCFKKHSVRKLRWPDILKNIQHKWYLCKDCKKEDKMKKK